MRGAWDRRERDKKGALSEGRGAPDASSIELIPQIEMIRSARIPGFSCSKCAHCCKGKVIALYEDDIQRLGIHADGSVDPMSREESELTGARFKMRMVHGSCAFLVGNRCQHYDLRPNTCRRHPFIVTERNTLVASTCRGIDWSGEGRREEYFSLSKMIAPKIDDFLDSIEMKKTGRR